MHTCTHPREISQMLDGTTSGRFQNPSLPPDDRANFRNRRNSRSSRDSRARSSARVAFFFFFFHQALRTDDTSIKSQRHTLTTPVRRTERTLWVRRRPKSAARSVVCFGTAAAPQDPEVGGGGSEPWFAVASHCGGDAGWSTFVTRDGNYRGPRYFGTRHF